MSKNSGRALFVILNYNGWRETIECLDSVFKQTATKFSVLLIDNGSHDDSVRHLEKFENHEKVTFVRQPRNLGFAGGVNVGIRHAINHGYDFVVLLNNDAVLSIVWFEKLLLAIQKSNASAVTGLLLNSEGTRIDSTSDIYSLWGMPFPRNRKDTLDNTPASGYVFGATGGATLYRTSLFKKIGLFDESFFAYYEDVDISFRAQLAGCRVYFTNEAIAYHKQGASSRKIPGFTVYQTFKNIPLLYTKNVPFGLLVPVGVRLLLLYWLIFANAIKNGKGWYALKGWLMSIWLFWTKALWRRFKIQRSRKVPTSYIKSIIYPGLPPDQTGMRKFRRFFTGKP